MNVLIIGNGAREHTINYMISKSANVGNIYSIKPNAGMKKISTEVNLDYTDELKLRQFIINNRVELVIVGPEKPLVDGITDSISDICKVFGPTKRASQLEGSKVFAKEFMEKYSIPTAKSATVVSEVEAKKVSLSFGFPHVWKVDGLAGGKGVLITNTEAEDKEVIDKLFCKKVFGSSADEVILEEFLEGEEISVFALFDNNSYKYFSNAKDHKRAYDNDEGPNTGGMGSLSPIDMTDREKDEIDSIIEKTFYGVKAEGFDYRGVIFIGLMKTKSGIKVLEYNVRFGDPETQVMLPRLKSDLLDVMYKCANNELDKVELSFDSTKGLNVVIASKGYPENVEKNKVVSIRDIGGNILFVGGCYGTDELVTTSGRVFSLVAFTESFEKSREMVYNSIDNIKFEGAWYRKDI